MSQATATSASPSGTVHRGHCLCGAVTVSFAAERPSVGACHCSMCRRWGGGPMFTADGHEPARIDGEEHVRVYPSSDWAERGFCGQCGTHLFYRLKTGGFHAFPAGLFDDSGDWPFELQVFVDERPANYRFANQTREMTGAEVAALFEPPPAA